LLNLVDGGTKVGPPAFDKARGNALLGFKKDGVYQSTAYAALYQMTGEPRYADLCRQAIERYYLPEYAEQLKSYLNYLDDWNYGYPLNFVVAEMICYDLCYDAWPPEFRKKIADRLGKIGTTLAARPDDLAPLNALEPLASAKPWSVGEIHEGETIPKGGFLHLGYKGMGMPRNIFLSQVLLLGLKGDPEAIDAPWDQLLTKARDRFERTIPLAFGEHGRHKQFKMWGWMISGEFQLDDALLAWRNAGGIDYTQNERVRWINIQWLAELLQREDGQDVLVATAGPGVEGLPDSEGVIRPGLRTENWNEDFGPLVSDEILTVGDKKIRITTVGDSPHPKPTVVGNTVHVGKRIVSLSDKGLIIAPAK